MMGISWRTVGHIVERVVGEKLDPKRLDGLKRIGVDEFSYRKRHRYITTVVDHDTHRIVRAAEGKSSQALDAFFEEPFSRSSERSGARRSRLSPSTCPARSSSPLRPRCLALPFTHKSCQTITHPNHGFSARIVDAGFIPALILQDGKKSGDKPRIYIMMRCSVTTLFITFGMVFFYCERHEMGKTHHF